MIYAQRILPHIDSSFSIDSVHDFFIGRASCGENAIVWVI
jgi:hypothetical protein